MQSRRPGNQTSVAPQRNPQQGGPIKSAPANSGTEARELVKGNTLNQIYSYDNFLFSISSTFEKLYRYRFDPFTNEVVEILTFRRVRNGDSEMINFRNMKEAKPKKGRSTQFDGRLYDVCCLISNGNIRGYVLYARTVCNYEQKAVSERIYYAYEKYEKKEGM